MAVRDNVGGWNETGWAMSDEESDDSGIGRKLVACMCELHDRGKEQVVQQGTAEP